MNEHLETSLMPEVDVSCGVLFHKNGSFQFFDTVGGSQPISANDNGADENGQRMRAIATLLAVPQVMEMVLSIADELDLPKVSSSL